LDLITNRRASARAAISAESAAAPFGLAAPLSPAFRSRSELQPGYSWLPHLYQAPLR